MDNMKLVKGEGVHPLGLFAEATIEPPRLRCPKGLAFPDSNFKMIPLVVKPEENQKNIFIPFKNDGSKDLEFALNLMDLPRPGSKSLKEGLAEYQCQKMPFKLQAKSSSYMIINVNRYPNKGAGKKEKKLLIMEIKDTSMIYTYILDFYFLN